jgi:3',5'-cyclic AMP phosphodiesterase CpdA
VQLTTGFSFIQLADPQFGLFASSSRKTDEEIATFAKRGLIIRKAPLIEGFTPETALFTRAIEHANWLKPAFVVVCGDMVNECDNDDQVTEVKRIAGLLHPSIPIHWVPGNHDVAVDHINPDLESIESYRQNFGSDYYAFSHGGVRFIVINSTLFTSPGPLVDRANAQLAFVDAEATIARDRSTENQNATGGQVQTVLFSHHPLFVETPDEADNPWSITRQYRMPLLEIAADRGIGTNFAGHWHRNNVVKRNGLEVISSGSVGYPLWHDPSGFRVAKVTAGEITHEYHSLEVDD